MGRARWSEFGDEVNHHRMLVEMDIFKGDAVENGCQLGTLAKGEHQAVAVKDVEQVGALLFLELAKGGADHELDACPAAVGEEDVGAIDAVDIDVEADGAHEGHFVGDAEGVRTAVGKGEFFAGLFLNELSDFGIGEIELHNIVSFVMFFCGNNA